MVTASRIWLLPTWLETQSRSAWEMAWAALAAQRSQRGRLVLYSVAIGDFNGDGKQDLAVANHTQPQSRSAWEMAWAALAAQRMSAWALILFQ